MPSRLLTLLAALFATTLLVAGCGGADTDDVDPSPSPTATDEASPTATPTDDATEGADPTPTPTATPDATEPTDPAETEVASGDTDGDAGGDTDDTDAGTGDPAGDAGDDADTGDTGGGTDTTGGGTQGQQQPTTAFPPVAAGEDDPCILSSARVGEITGNELALLGPTGSEEYRTCTYGEPSDPYNVDLILVDLQAVSDSAGEPVDGELYISDLRSAAGEGEVQDLDALGDGSAILVTDSFSSTAWAHVGNQVYGASASGFDDDAEAAESLLQAVLADVAP